MKRLLILLVLSLTLTGCFEGPTGPKGDTGPAGENASVIKHTGFLTTDIKDNGFWDNVYTIDEGKTPIVNVYVRPDGETVWLVPLYATEFEENSGAVNVRIYETFYFYGTPFNVTGWEYLITLAY